MPAVAIGQNATQAHLPHLAKRALQRAAVGVPGRVAASRHTGYRNAAQAGVKLSITGGSERRELLRVVGVEKQVVRQASFEPSQCAEVVLSVPLAMSPSEKPGPDREAPEPKPSRVEEARRIIRGICRRPARDYLEAPPTPPLTRAH